MLGAVLACALVALLVAWRYRPRSAPGGKWRLVPWFFLLPAVASILLWSYYPLFRGAFMAFQDYRIVGQSAFAGLDNFIRVALDPNFWAAWVRTFEYVAITLLLGFLTPIFLALMLCEIPKGKVFFRFLYFLPHLTSALVVTLLWKAHVRPYRKRNLEPNRHVARLRPPVVAPRPQARHGVLHSAGSMGGGGHQFAHLHRGPVFAP